MVLENKLEITSSSELAREEERISKRKTVKLFENGMLDSLTAGKFLPYRKFISFCLKIYMILLGLFGP